MRMMASDVEDVQGFVPLINGKDANKNWTGLFRPGERVRLRFINSSAMTYFDIRIPGLKMTVVAADGNNVLPVPVDEFRIAVAETYDVIVHPKDDKAYTIFAESMGRTAFGRGTLAPRTGMTAEIPKMRESPLLTMMDMGMAHGDMDHGMAGSSSKDDKKKSMQHGGHGSKKPGSDKMTGMNHGAHGAMSKKGDPFYATGSGLMPKAANGGRFLSYKDLRAQKRLYKHRPATREIELRLTGNMERYAWSINGIKYEDADPIKLHEGERVRFKFVNETMMTHPMHLHGMWTIIDTGSGKWNPIKHTVSIAPGTTVYTETEVDAVGEWAFHCHLSYHAAAGMFRKVIVEPRQKSARLSIGQ